MRFVLIIISLSFLPGSADAGAKSPPIQPPTLAAKGPAPPWKMRRRVGIRGGMRRKGQGLIDLKSWPPEPAPPETASVDPVQLARALSQICHDWMPPKRPVRYARWILEYAARFKVDPFTLAALVYRQSRCLPRQTDNYGAGLTKINLRMHGPYLRKRAYRYWVVNDGAWTEMKRPLPDYAFIKGNLRRAKANLYFAAGLLSIYKEQCPALDSAFGSVPHRHHVSHFIYGDRVQGAGAEDRILRARRRLLEYYREAKPAAVGKHRDLELFSPMDGLPRKVTICMGRDRSDGVRRHKGLDFASTWGEPVRAVAAGRVSMAGLDRPSGRPKDLEPELTKEVKASEMGPGGLFVMIRHKGGLVSAYMHLSDYLIKTGDRVKAGQLIGHVGKTGIKQSGAHLHFELRHGGKHIDPLPFYGEVYFAPEATYRGNMILQVEKRKRRRRRIRRRRERAARKSEQEK